MQRWIHVGKCGETSRPFRRPALPGAAARWPRMEHTGHRTLLQSTTQQSMFSIFSLSFTLLLSTPAMSLTALKNRLQCFIQSMYDEGIVNDQFFQLQSMKEVLRRDYVVRAVTSFCVSCIRLFSNLTDLIYQQEVNFHKVHVLALELYARTTGVGAESVKHECAELLYASEMKDKNHCYQALYRIKNEFSYLRRKLETLVQMERRIIDLDS